MLGFLASRKFASMTCRHLDFDRSIAMQNCIEVLRGGGRRGESGTVPRDRVLHFFTVPVRPHQDASREPLRVDETQKQI